MNINKARASFPKISLGDLEAYDITDGIKVYDNDGNLSHTEHLAMLSLTNVEVTDDDEKVIGSIRPTVTYLQLNGYGKRIMVDYRDLWKMFSRFFQQGDFVFNESFSDDFVYDNITDDEEGSNEDEVEVESNDGSFSQVIKPPETETEYKAKARFAVIVDDFGSIVETVDEQIQSIVEHFNYIGIDVDLVYFGTNVHEFISLGKKVDVIVIDYGGVSSATQNYMQAEYVLRELCDYALDNPNTLLLIWTTFTRYAYEGELEDEFGELNNICIEYSKSLSEGYKLGNKKVMSWLGIEENKED